MLSVARETVGEGERREKERERERENKEREREEGESEEVRGQTWQPRGGRNKKTVPQSGHKMKCRATIRC